MIFYRCTVARAETMASPASNQSIGNFLGGKEVLSAEVYRALHVADKHYSFKSCDTVGDLFHKMFPDSEMACKLLVAKRSVPIFLLSALLLTYKFSLSKVKSANGCVALWWKSTPTFNRNNWTFKFAFGKVVKYPAIFRHLKSWDMLMQTAYMKNSLTAMPLLVSKVCFRFQWMAPVWTGCFPQALRKKFIRQSWALVLVDYIEFTMPSALAVWKPTGKLDKP